MTHVGRQIIMTALKSRHQPDLGFATSFVGCTVALKFKTGWVLLCFLQLQGRCWSRWFIDIELISDFIIICSLILSDIV